MIIFINVKKKKKSLSSIFFNCICRPRTERDIHASGEESRFDTIKRWSEKKVSMPCHGLANSGKSKRNRKPESLLFFWLVHFINSKPNESHFQWQYRNENVGSSLSQSTCCSLAPSLAVSLSLSLSLCLFLCLCSCFHILVREFSFFGSDLCFCLFLHPNPCSCHRRKWVSSFHPCSIPK
jgi:hypothetical protein